MKFSMRPRIQQILKIIDRYYQPIDLGFDSSQDMNKWQ